LEDFPRGALFGFSTAKILLERTVEILLERTVKILLEELSKFLLKNCQNSPEKGPTIRTTNITKQKKK
jgi:hypothetical protein